MKASPNAGRSGPGNAARRNAALRAASSRPRAPSASAASPPVVTRRGGLHTSKKLNHWVGCSPTIRSSGGHPGASRLLFAAARNRQRLGHRHGVPVALVEHAERGDERHADGPGEEEWPERERRGRSEEGEEHVAAAAERPVALHGDHLAAPECRHQLERRRSGATATRSARPSPSRRTQRARSRASSSATTTCVGAPGAAREETTGQLPVADVGRQRDEPALEMRDTLGAVHARHVGVQARRGLPIRGHADR